MRFATCSTAVFCVGALIGGSVAPAQPVPAPPPAEALPAPRVVPVEPPVVVYGPYLPPVPYRVSSYEVWQNLAVNRQGMWVPRVMLTPYGAYYAVDGKPYPWTSLIPRNFMPYASE